MSNTHNMVAHAWANQTGKQKQGFAMHYEGPTIYSWGRHFPIATHTRTLTGERCILFTSKDHSVSTSKHKTVVRRAAHGLLFVVENVMAREPHEHQANYEKRLSHAAEVAGRAKRARTNKGWLTEQAESILREAAAYADAFGCTHSHATLETLQAAMAEQAERHKAAIARANAEREARLRAQRIEQRQNLNPDLVRWLDGEEIKAVGLTHRYAMSLRPFVRVKGEVVETTWGARVPKDAAIKAFTMAAKCRALGRTWEAGIAAPRVGDFRLTKIGPTGNLVVGCHNIPFRHMKLAADRAGITLGEFGAWERETVHPEANALRDMTANREGGND